MHYTGITLFIVFVVASGPFGEKSEWYQKKKEREKDLAGSSVSVTLLIHISTRTGASRVL